MTATAQCPVCGGASLPLLSLAAQPIYQHPVAVDAVVPPPHAVDLAWVACADCAHAWQPAFDAKLLESIYREHYYTPAPDGLAVQFRNDFVSAVTEQGLLCPRRAVVEIGASDGGLLAEIQSRTAAGRAIAFEPDASNAALARSRGLEVREQFFGYSSTREDRKLADFVYARHVIEHVFDFADFFAGLDAIALPAADLVFETPSLDHHAGTTAVTPFHVEHVHVFSGRSLAALARRQGWQLARSRVTADGNLIASFERAASVARRAADEAPPVPALGGLQERVDRYRARMRELLTGQATSFSGGRAARRFDSPARSGGHRTIGPTAIQPRSARNSSGSIRSSCLRPTRSRPSWQSADSGAVVVIASSFVREILPTVRKLGWRGETLDLEGNRL